MVNAAGGTLSCCGQPMQLLKENSVDAATEKHVPVVEKIEGGYRVTVGEVEHPMTEEHSIEWIELITETEVLRKHLKPTDKPVAVFKTDATEVYAREYCNLHGLWRSK
ncbi:MAG: desulfoferrodoxin [Prevotella sp.]|nr:desulfoferrodoxin [Prevotella sp.]